MLFFPMHSLLSPLKTRDLYSCNYNSYSYIHNHCKNGRMAHKKDNTKSWEILDK